MTGWFKRLLRKPDACRDCGPDADVGPCPRLSDRCPVERPLEAPEIVTVFAPEESSIGMAKNKKCLEWAAQVEGLQQDIIATCERSAVWDLPETKHLRRARVAIDDLLQAIDAVRRTPDTIL